MLRRRFTAKQHVQYVQRQITLTFKLHLRLHDLVHQALAGNVAAVVDFQRLIQYAPQTIRESLQKVLESKITE